MFKYYVHMYVYIYTYTHVHKMTITRKCKHTYIARTLLHSNLNSSIQPAVPDPVANFTLPQMQWPLRNL